jgi:thiol-disulfide isomerase/thioredoxin
MRLLSCSGMLLLLGASFGQRIQVSVQVRDAAGKPVANTPVSAQWVPKFPEIKLPLIPMEALYTGQDGIATGTVEGDYPIVLSAFDQDKHLGGFVAIYKDTREAVIKLAPMQAVQIPYSVRGLSGPLKMAYLQVQIVVPEGRPNSSIARDGYAFPISQAPLYLPPGKYRFLPGAANAHGEEQWLDVPAMDGVFTTPTFVLTATKVATLAGRSAPEIKADGVLNAAPTVSLAKYRGKWVLIDFWGTWCSACRREMPSLIDFYANRRAQRSKFELLLLHDSTQKTVAALNREIAKLVRSDWHGKALPFPVLLDYAGKTVTEYGITAFPTQVLIDPQGRIVDGGNLETLKRELAKSGK